MKKLILATLCLLASLQVSAQDTSGAEAVMSKYAQTTRSYDTAAMTSLMHPEALKRFRTAIAAALQGPKGDLAKTQLLPMFSAATAADFSNLSDAEAYKRLNDTIARSAPELIDMMSKATYEILGSFVKDGIAYVTYNLRASAQGAPVSTQAVQKLKMHNGQWLLMLPATAEASIAGIEAQFNK